MSGHKAGRNVAIVLAGGVGERMNAPVPKQFLDLGGRPIIIRTLEKFDASPMISEVVVVCHEGHVGTLSTLVEKFGIKKTRVILPGGETRQESSQIGIRNCPDGTEYVIIHDAVRPFLDEIMIEDTLKAAEAAGAATTVIGTTDTMVVSRDGFMVEISAREHLKRVQTPQGFRYSTIVEAHEWADANGVTNASDDCGLVLGMGMTVRTVDGSPFNIKITDVEDLSIAEMFLKKGAA
jgi:2-C-methyl-D-erythritol 4-phosphate cytidylyltransferase